MFCLFRYAGGKVEHFILADWPANYAFTIHHTANGKGPGKDRTDPYLFGMYCLLNFLSFISILNFASTPNINRKYRDGQIPNCQ